MIKPYLEQGPTTELNNVKSCKTWGRKNRNLFNINQTLTSPTCQQCDLKPLSTIYYYICMYICTIICIYIVYMLFKRTITYTSGFLILIPLPLRCPVHHWQGHKVFSEPRHNAVDWTTFTISRWASKNGKRWLTKGDVALKARNG